jgi:hypothetical protein
MVVDNAGVRRLLLQRAAKSSPARTTEAEKA